MNELEATKLTPPVVLTESDAEAVAGGATTIVNRPGSCQACTSGGYRDPRFTQVINPVESV
jgi:hypothetical protein